MTDAPEPSTKQDSRPQDVSSLQLRLPPFWPQNPQVWFHQIEAQFCLYRFTSETVRYCSVASVLPPDVASELSDVLSASTGATPYQVLERFIASERTRLQQLFNEEDLGDRRPSHLLCRIRQLLGERDVPTHSALLRELLSNAFLSPSALSSRRPASSPWTAWRTSPIRFMRLPPRPSLLPYRLHTRRFNALRPASMSSPPQSLHSGAPHKGSVHHVSAIALLCAHVKRGVPAIRLSAGSTSVSGTEHEVPTSLFVTAKRLPRSLKVACRSSCLFVVIDKFSGAQFLIDTSAEVSVVPPTKADRFR
ncbi:uncharacterized protein [Dermacentor albipictus]|uniref:uncharacterized protein n=1 Tax=Dermacentor albipictus TaxID=60249 RepID=UPI0031FC5AD1